MNRFQKNKREYHKHTLEIVGTYPPPYGGVSVHIERLLPFLDENSVPYVVYNKGFSKANNVIPIKKSTIWFIKYLFTPNKNLIHFHIQYYGLEYFYYFLFSIINTNRIIITIHNEYLLRNWIIEKLIFFFLKRTSYIQLIAVSEKVNEVLLKNNIQNTYLPAYVPYKKINQKYSKIKKIIIMNAFILNKTKINTIYGFDLAFRLMQELPKNYYLQIMISKYDQACNKEFIKMIKKNRISDRVIIIYGAKLIEHLNRAILLIRPNRIDGYGVSLQESLEQNVPIVASDVCKRPKGTILFKSNDFNNFKEKVIRVLNMNNEEKQKIFSQVEKLDYHLKLIQIYKKYL